MQYFTDQMNRVIDLPDRPLRIVSLVPSQTELLYDLGLEEEVVGITKFCIHPGRWFRTRKRIGGTKRLHLDTIRQLEPDLIIGNKEENERSQIEMLMQEFPVWMSDIHTLEDACEMIGQVGMMTGKETPAQEIVQKIRKAFKDLYAFTPTGDGTAVNCAYLIWKEPWMAAGGDTFIDDMLQRCGWKNIFAKESRYPQVALSYLQKADCGLVLLSSEPYPFKERHAAEIRAVLPNAKILLADGEMFSWYGSRLMQAPAYFRELIVQAGDAAS